MQSENRLVNTIVICIWLIWDPTWWAQILRSPFDSLASCRRSSRVTSEPRRFQPTNRWLTSNSPLQSRLGFHKNYSWPTVQKCRCRLSIFVGDSEEWTWAVLTPRMNPNADGIMQELKVSTPNLICVWTQPPPSVVQQASNKLIFLSFLFYFILLFFIFHVSFVSWTPCIEYIWSLRI